MRGAIAATGFERRPQFYRTEDEPMFTKRIQLVNYGPIEKLNIEFPFDGDAPKPVVLVGPNGSGKSILLSHVVNGLLKAKDIVYPETPEVEPGRVYKLKSNFYIKSGSQFYFGRVDFEDGLYVSELTTMRAKQDYSDVPPGIIGTAAEPMWQKTEVVSNDYSESNFDYATFNKLTEIFARNCILYFPSNRFEEPAWLNKENLTAQVEYVDRKRMVAHTSRQAIATSPLQDNRNWLFDVIYDRRVPETRTVRVPLPSPDGPMPWYIEAEQAEIRDHDEGVLKAALQVTQHVLRDDSNASFRISRRRNRFVGIHGDRGTIVPNIFQLSSGEMSLLNLFLSILRDFESSGAQFSSASDIRGIVVVDEIDLHLHAIHQHEVLPELIKMFPNVQFVVTTHSPLFVLGMRQVFGEEGFAIYRLPDGQQITPEEFSEFGEAYRSFSTSRTFAKDIKEALERENKPILLPEGETDIRYLQRAAQLLGKQEVLDAFLLKDGGGAGNLTNIFKHFHTPLPELLKHPVVLLFDSDKNKPHKDNGRVYQRSIPLRPDNPLKTGIENLFARVTLERALTQDDTLVDIESAHEAHVEGHKQTVPERWTVNDNQKRRLCNWLCEYGEAEDFQPFTEVLNILDDVLKADSSQSPDEGETAASGEVSATDEEYPVDVAPLRPSIE